MSAQSAHQVSPSMVQSVFRELKANGYSDAQIAALSRGLMSMATSTLRAAHDSGEWSCNGSWLNLPEEFESTYLAGLV